MLLLSRASYAPARRRSGGSVSLAEHAFAVYSIGGYSNEILLGASALVALCTDKFLKELNGEHIAAGEAMRVAYEKDDEVAARLECAQQRARAVSQQLEAACEAEARAALLETETARVARSCPDELLLKAATTHAAAVEARAAHAAAAVAVDELAPVLASARAELKAAKADATVSAAELAAARMAFEAQAHKVRKWVQVENEAKVVFASFRQLAGAVSDVVRAVGKEIVDAAAAAAAERQALVPVEATQPIVDIEAQPVR